MAKRKDISLRKDFDAHSSVSKVEVFKLDEPRDNKLYTEIINNEEYLVYKEEFSYDRLGSPVITIW